MSGKLTAAQARALERLSKVQPGNVYECGGHEAAVCFRLERRGLTMHRGYLASGLRSAFTITPAGRAALSEQADGEPR
jgi:hypothetical protein